MKSIRVLAARWPMPSAGVWRAWRKGLQVLAVTHSPQVAARASEHMLISKMEEVGSHRMVTRVQSLSDKSRREEVARMLSGAQVTDEARAQADRLLAAKG